MKLTESQRWILINQYEILARLDPSDKKHCEDAIEALQEGYWLHYDEFVQITPDKDTLAPKACEEVLRILSMYRAITFSYKNLPGWPSYFTGAAPQVLPGQPSPHLYGFWASHHWC